MKITRSPRASLPPAVDPFDSHAVVSGPDVHREVAVLTRRVIGMPCAEARALLESEGFVVRSSRGLRPKEQLGLAFILHTDAQGRVTLPELG